MSNPFSHLAHNQAAENNKAFIHQALSELGLLQQKVLEVGSGTGQQGIYLCQQNQQLSWQPTEVASNLDNLRLWHQVAHEQSISNFLTPIKFEIGQALPDVEVDSIYTSNVLHIVSKDLAKQLVEQVTGKLSTGQLFICYGPFKRDGEFTTESNRDFNDWLQGQGYGGINDLDDIVQWSGNKLDVQHLCDMPANNFLVVYQKN